MEEDKKADSKALPEAKEEPVEAADANPEQDLVGEAKKAALEIKQGLAERERILAREEKLVARQEALRSLGGGSLAGQRPIAETEDEKWAREAKLRYAGTGMDPT